MNGFGAVANLKSILSVLSSFPSKLDVKYLSPLMLAYEDRMNEKDALVQSTEVKCECVCVCEPVCSY